MDISVVLDMRRWLSVAALSLSEYLTDVFLHYSENPLSEMLWPEFEISLSFSWILEYFHMYKTWAEMETFVF